MQVAVARNLLPRPAPSVGEAGGKQLAAFRSVDLGVHCGNLLQTRSSRKLVLRRKFENQRHALSISLAWQGAFGLLCALALINWARLSSQK
jgi:hypothetical protein